MPSLMRLLMGLAGLLVCCSMTMAAAPESSHKQAKSLIPEFEGKRLQLNTFCLGPDSNLWMCCSDSAGAPDAGSIMIVEPTGEFVKRITLEFVPQAINFSLDGKTAFVAGSGMIAKLDCDGKIVKSIKAPNLLDEAEMKKKLEEAQKKQLDQVVATYDEQIKRIEKQLGTLREQLAESKEKEDERGIKRAEARIKVLDRQLSSMSDMAKQVRDTYTQAYSGDSIMARVKRATAVAVTKQDVFVTLPSVEGYGYVLWRMNHDLGDAASIKDDLSGCCGQLDIQTDGENILVAENTSFRVAKYDRDGKELAHFGQRGTDKESGWGSCCNPMNIRCCGDDEILTAESSIGAIKRYTKDGKYLGLIGTARIGGGCKHVALSVDHKRNWYFIMNQNANSIAVLVPKDQATDDTPEEKASREAREGLGKKLQGAWEYKAAAAAQPAASAVDQDASLEQFVVQQYAYLHFHEDGGLDTTRPAKGGKPGESSGIGALFGGVIQAVTGDSTVNSLVNPKSNWDAVKQTEDSIEFVVVAEGVRGFGGTVKFVDADTASIQWFYDSPETAYGKPITYKRIPGVCCEEGKPCERSEQSGK